jgi:23S rRNA pseudouridine2605 synthase
MTAMRLQRALARAGIASRRAAEDLIRAGRVRVNGRVASLGMSVDPANDTVMVGSQRVTLGVAPAQWYVLNKPVGYVTSRRGQRGRQTVFELVPETPGLTYVGRLDMMTSGLALLTTDGVAAHRLTHPRYAVPRTYRAIVRGDATPRELRHRLSTPVVVDGRAVAITGAGVRGTGRGRLELQLTLTEGRYRIVRRLCQVLGLSVEQLVRTSHGPVELGDLPPGKWRRLTHDEQQALGALGPTAGV